MTWEDDSNVYLKETVLTNAQGPSAVAMHHKVSTELNPEPLPVTKSSFHEIVIVFHLCVFQVVAYPNTICARKSLHISYFYQTTFPKRVYLRNGTVSLDGSILIV